MKIEFYLDNENDDTTPMRVAQALIDTKCFSYRELRELSDYLSIYARYNEK